MPRPASISSYPLLAIAKEEGADYGTVLNLAHGIRAMLNHKQPNVWYGKALKDLHAHHHYEKGAVIYNRIVRWVSGQEQFVRAWRADRYMVKEIPYA